MLHTKFQASEQSGSEEEDFLMYFYAFLWFERRTPGQRPSWTLGPSLNKLGRGALGNASYPISNIWAKWF